LKLAFILKTTALAKRFDAVCVFVNKEVNNEVLVKLKEYGVKLIALRVACFNNVNIEKAKELDIGIFRVPAYSPYTTAEHAVRLLPTLNRKYHKAHPRVRRIPLPETLG
jgi:D-lactate dehydrogenase